MDETMARRASELLVRNWREGTVIDALPAPLRPADRAEGYAIQALLEHAGAGAPRGWKIAATNEEMRRALRTDSPIYGRVYAGCIASSPYRVARATLCSPIPEVEYQVRLGADLPVREKPYTVEEVTDAVASLHPGLELAECRFIHDAAFPPLPAILADGAGCGTLIPGPAITDWRNRDIAGQEVTLSSNGTIRRRGTAAAALEHPLVPLTWLANELSRTGIGMKAGQMISTGTMTGMLAPKPGETFVADFGPFGSVTLIVT